MKQTNNAIKFLLAQYRAIYKHATLRNLATASILTLALASSASVATSISGASSWNDASGEKIFNQGDSFSVSENKFFDHLIINATDATLDNTISIKGSLVINANKGLKLTNGVLAGYANLSGDFSGGASHLTNNGTLILDGNGSSYTRVSMHDVILKSGSKTFVSDKSTTSPSKWYLGSFIAGGYENGTFLIEKGASVTVGNHASLVSDQTSTLDIKGTVELKNSNGYAFIRAADNISGNNKSGTDISTLSIDGGQIVVSKVAGGTNYSGGGLFAAKANLINNGQVNVKSGALLTIDGDINSGDKIEETTKALGIFTVNGGSISVEKDAKLIVGAGSNPQSVALATSPYTNSALVIESGSFTNAGTTEVQGNLVFEADAKYSNTGTIKVAEGGNLQYDIKALNPVTKTAKGIIYNFADLNTALGTVQNSGTMILSYDAPEHSSNSLIEEDIAVFHVNKLTDLGLKYGTEDDKYKGKLSIGEGVSLIVKSDLSLNKGHFTGGSSILSGNGTIFADNVTYKTAGSADRSDSLTLASNNLTFTQDNISDSQIIASGGNFEVNESLNLAGGATTLVLSGAHLSLGNINYNPDDLSAYSIDSSVNADIVVSGSSTLQIYNNAWTLKNLEVNSSGATALDIASDTVNGDKATLDMLKLEVKDGSVNINDMNRINMTNITFKASDNTFTMNKVKDFNATFFALEAGSASFTDSVLDFSEGMSTKGSATFDDSSITAQYLRADSSGAYEFTNSSINILGDGKADTADLNLGSMTFTGSNVKINDVAGSLQWTASDNAITASSGQAKADNTKFTVNLGGLNLSSLSIEEANKVLGYLATGSGNVVTIEGVATSLDGAIESSESGSFVSFDKIKDNSGNLSLNFDTTQSQSASLVGVKGSVTGGWKNIQLESNTGSAKVAGGSLALYGASSNGNLVETKDGKVAGVSLGDSSALHVNSQGKVGAITGTGSLVLGTNSNLEVVDTNGKAANVSVSLEGAGKLSANEIRSDKINLGEGSEISSTKVVATGSFNTLNTSLTTETLDISGVENSSITGGKTTVSNKIDANSLTLDKEALVSAKEIKGNILNIEGGSSLIAETVELNNKGVLSVGSEKEGGSTGSLVAKSISLNGGSLVIDPEFGQKTATVFTNSLGSVSSARMTVDGDIIVGRNSALGIGSSEENFKASLAKYQTNGSLNEEEIGAYVYIDRNNIALNGKKLIIGAEDINTLKTIATTDTDNVYLGDGSAIQVTTSALNTDSSVFVGANKIKSVDGTFIVPANIKGEDIAKIFGTEAVLSSGKIYVTTENGLYRGWINSTEELTSGNFSFTMEENSRDYLDVSDSTYDYLMTVFSPDTAYHADENAFDAAEVQYGTNGIAVVEDAYGYRFLQDVMASNNTVAIEQTARLAAFAGVAQATHTASRATSDAISSRFGMAMSDSKLAMANNGQGAALWVTPIYKSHDIDNLKGQGIDYGADLDLFGAALGFDYTLANGMRMGAMFNVGSGDSEGQGAGVGVKDDFSYYSFGAYAGFSPMQNLSVSADLSYTVLDNDLTLGKTAADWGKLTSSTDSSALSLGANVQYTFSSSALDIAPHVGMRFTRVDIDNYIVKSAHGEIAYTTTDAMNIFSIPVGVSLSKDIVTGSWTIRPAADFTVTANFGDDSMKSKTEFDGILGDYIDFNTEVIDNFTYGAELGLSGSNGAFSFGINAGYTGSSNSKEFSVGGNARLAF